MRHRNCLVLALATALSVMAFAGPANAAAPQTGQPGLPGPSASSKQKQQAYGRMCGTGHKRANAARQQRSCLDAMAKIAAGKAGSPKAACRALKPKRAKRSKGAKQAKRSSKAYKRCLKAAGQLQNGQQTADDKAAAQQEAADALEEQQAEQADQNAQDALDDPTGDNSPPTQTPDVPDPGDDPVEAFDEPGDTDV